MIGKGYCSAPASPASLWPGFESEPRSHTGTCFRQMVCLQGMKTRRWEDISVCVVHATPFFPFSSFSWPHLFYLSLPSPHVPVPATTPDNMMLMRCVCYCRGKIYVFYSVICTMLFIMVHVCHMCIVSRLCCLQMQQVAVMNRFCGEKPCRIQPLSFQWVIWAPFQFFHTLAMLFWSDTQPVHILDLSFFVISPIFLKFSA